MKPHKLKMTLRDLAVSYAEKRRLRFDASHKTALIFKNIQDNFIPESYTEITKNESWADRLHKSHPNVDSAVEMQSSNSSDALLMNIFCYPSLGKYTGLPDLLNVKEIKPVFGFKAGVALNDGTTDNTEIDMVIEDIFFEAKLTENNFTQKNANIVHAYTDFSETFDEEALPCPSGRYENYQIIRNLLAAKQWGKRHILLCDARRDDLTEQYHATVACLKDDGFRKMCRVIFWQDIQRLADGKLRQFLSDKYGIG